MYSTLVLLPLLGSLFAGGFGFLLGFRGAALVTTLCVASSFLLSGGAFYEVALCASDCSLSISPWFSCELFDSCWGLYFDTLTVVMLIVVTSVSTLVHIYSISYMDGDPHLPRFMCYLSLFTFFMLTLVTADNLLQMFFGWEGVGLASYLLINFWFTRIQASKSSIKAMVMNRVGDFALALGIMGLFSLFKTVNFSAIFALAAHLSETPVIFCNFRVDALFLICILLFIGSCGKSAQLGLHTWLPDAMEGPTPVSALIHAATMVTAGVFMIARCSPLFEYAPAALQCVTFVGGATCFFAATCGIAQNDLKRVIAYSTCSQFGYMVFACGISHYSLAVFHLVNHAFFKALLFLGAGSVIHALSNQQDMRKMGGLAQLLPFTYGMMLIGTLSLAGFPFLTGFYSKDLILESTFSKWTISATFAYWLGAFCVAITSYYSFRLLFLTFLTSTGGDRQAVRDVHEAPLLIALPLLLLAIGAVFAGYLGRDMMIGCGTNFWGNSLFTLPQNQSLVEAEWIPEIQKCVPLLATLLGGIGAYTFQYAHTSWSLQITKSLWARKIYGFLNKRWLFDKVYNQFLAQKGLDFGYKIGFKALDKGTFEMIGPSGITLLFRELSRYVSQLQSGIIYHYAVVMIIGLTLLISVIGLQDFFQVFIDNRLYFIFITTFLYYNYYSALV